MLLILVSLALGRAACFKDDGNDFFKKKLYRDAILAYTEGLKEKVDEEHIQLRVTLLSNRAASQYRLGKSIILPLFWYSPGAAKGISNV